jgi:hypothetical protein
LAWIEQAKACQLDVGKALDDQSKVVTNPDNLVVTWLYEGHGCSRVFEFSVDVEPIVHGGVHGVLMEREITDSTMPKDKEELIYSEVMNTWLSPALTKAFDCLGDHVWCHGVPVPSEVAVWLNQKLTIQNPCYRGDRCAGSTSRRLGAVCSPQVDENTSLAVLAVEVLLPFTFSNQMLLTEALTHGSYDIAKTPPNTKLATLGRWLVETMLTRAIIQRTGFPMHTTRTTEEDVEVKEPSQTFAVSALRHSMFHPVLFLYLHTVPGSRPDLG